MLNFKAGMFCKEVRRTATGIVVVLSLYPEATEEEGVGTQLVLNVENKDMERIGNFEVGKRYGMMLVEHDLPKVM